MNNKVTTIASLKGLKGWLIYSIVIFHVFGSKGILTNVFLPFKLYGGYLGNYTFFMLSGFLTAHSFSYNGISERSFFPYLVSKLVRFWPLYALCNLWQVGFLVYDSGFASIDISRLLLSLIMQTGGASTDMYPYVVPGWFLCTLMVCFVINYFVCYICKTNRKYYIWFSLGLFLWGIFLLNANLNLPFCYVHDGEGITCFFGGSILYEIYHFIRKYRFVLYVLSFLSAICLTLNSLFIIRDIRFLFIFFIAPSLILLSIEEKMITNILSCGLSQFLGGISMSVYLLHYISPLVYIPNAFSHYTVGFAVYILIIIIVSWVVTKISSYRLLKKIPFVSKVIR
ncbi:acyltransferase family protein [Butyrivibrio sp. FCS014]|uniref:acyltransferase family protein n=1 Tax=Butyrivibrio sp. FCS014 TaxID=1408304 RepID=UPI000465FC06